jgi:DNA-binding MarR family transcriptional regulator
MTTANSAWESLLSAHAVLTKRFAAEDSWHDLSMRDYDVLYSLAKRAGPVRITDLNRYVLLSQPALSRLVRRLAAAGLVECHQDPADGRSVLVSLTERGQARQRQLGQRHARSVATVMTAAVSRDELAQLETICRKLASLAEPAR